MPMILINFAHPITGTQRRQLEEQTGRALAEIRDVVCQFDEAQPLAGQVSKLVDGVGLSGTGWQAGSILVNPPGFAPAACILMAELHGRMGHFPAIVRLRPVDGQGPTLFELAEVLNLRAVRESARRSRSEEG